MTNNEFFEIYKHHLLRRSVPGTYAPRISQIRCHFLPLYGETDIESTSPSAINHMYEVMEDEGYARNTIFGAYAAVHIYFKLASEMGYISDNPAPLSRVISPENRRKCTADV